MVFPQHSDADYQVVSGPLSWFNPTVKRRPASVALKPKRSHLLGKRNEDIPDPSPPLEPQRTQGEPHTNAHHLWRSRDNRKGRHALIVPRRTTATTTPYVLPDPTNTLRSVAHNIWRMFIYWPIWDVSWLVAQFFTWGSVVWVFNAFFVWLPSVLPSSEFEGEETVAGGWTAFIGATIFEIGSVFLMIEAVNENRSDCFGWAFEEAVEEEEKGLIKIVRNKEGCTHHHRNRFNLVGRGRASRAMKDTQPVHAPSGVEKTLTDSQREQLHSWIWWPSYHDLRTHYIREIGFLACLSQFIGATIFWIAGFTALPQIQRALQRKPGGINGAYWAPQVVGGCGFIVSSLFFCLETQSRWWKPAPRTLGWWIGFWNLIGAVGFTMSGAFGYWVSSKGSYQAGLSTFWGSWAFLIGSVVQWYESLEKHPVEVDRGFGTQRAAEKGVGKTWTNDAVNGSHALESTERIPSVVH